MASGRRRNLLDSRRRVPDDGEDEDSGHIEQADDSASDVSILTDGDNDDNLADASESSEVEVEVEGEAAHSSRVQPHTTTPGDKKSRRRRKGDRSHAAQEVATVPDTVPAFTQNADVDAMANGIKPPPDAVAGNAIDFEDTRIHNEQSAIGATVPPVHGRHARSREGRTVERGTAEVVTDDAQNPALVPNRGGFFMHDHRHNARGSMRGRGRGRGAGEIHSTGPDNMTERWTHDLHDTVENQPSGHWSTRAAAVPSVPQNKHSGRPVSMSALLSKSIAIGTVTARVYLPSMKAPINFERMPVKQHTRLPDLRPPLRRDKPVRISIPNNPPRYIFPSTERSFIFIPRAQRPNQQGGRGRGRGYLSQNGSRRQSLYGGSSYAPSVAMSRRSSIARDGLVSPTGSARPVVKLPFNAQPFQPSMMAPNGIPMHAAPYPLPSQPTFRGVQSQIPMHQPRPQKAVSVATIESPNPDAFQAPQQQEQQPFHHQVPINVGAQSSSQHHTRHMSFHSQASGNTPLSNIPERAINAQPFQPTGIQPAYTQYPSYQGMYYYPVPEQPGQAPYVQPAMQNPYLVPLVGGPPTVRHDVAAQQQQQQQQQQQFAHEANGMVYFYDPSQLVGNSMEGAGGLHTPAPEGYWQAAPPPPMMYYPSQ